MRNSSEACLTYSHGGYQRRPSREQISHSSLEVKNQVPIEAKWKTDFHFHLTVMRQHSASATVVSKEACENRALNEISIFITILKCSYTNKKFIYHTPNQEDFNFNETRQSIKTNTKMTHVKIF